MAKVFTVISESQVITAKVGDKTTLVNASTGNIFLTDDATNTALNPTNPELQPIP
ncbi:hypothetical protein GO755_32900 [Spirosoma sp. HMF4905]|uniref:Uncharacterized protein n=1 Tax=Spirosoma arboris TaxID=2682092 RepID=A0A7K1SM66_9BACT|nr:hypothetical protein [Spirosoma arboris]MVM34874.1 hypothetical protein [Spirosoma arboris]